MCVSHRYVRVLFELYTWVVWFVQQNPGKSLPIGRTTDLFDALKSDAHIIRFPLFVKSNPTAHRDLVREVSGWLRLAPTDERVVPVYSALLELDVFVHAESPQKSGRRFLMPNQLFNDTPGFSLKTIHLTQSMLHNNMRWFKSHIIDVFGRESPEANRHILACLLAPRA